MVDPQQTATKYDKPKKRAKSSARTKSSTKNAAIKPTIPTAANVVTAPSTHGATVVNTKAGVVTAAPKTTLSMSSTPTQSTKLTNTLSTNTVKVVSFEMRQKMISEAAYYRSAQRGFVGGNSMEDWLAAEAQIDATLRSKSMHS